MFENYTYKTKCKALVILFIMLSITAYKRSFRSLFELIAEHKILSLKIDDMNSKSVNSSILKNEIRYLDDIIGKGGVTKQMIQQGIVDFATRSKNTSIYNVEAIHEFEDGDFTIITNQIDVTGNVNELIAMVYNFEKKFNLSKITSVRFYTVKKNNLATILHLKIIFQNYENNK